MLVLLLVAIAILWRPIFRGEVFLPLDLLAHQSPWGYSYEHTPYVNPIPTDILREYYPRRLIATQLIRQGQLPLWNPYILGGMPLLADGYSGVFYPASMLFVALPVGQAFGWFALIHLALAGLGMYWLVRCLRLQPLAALVAGLTYMGCGFTMTWLGFPDFSPVIAWLPVACACVERYEALTVNASMPASGSPSSRTAHWWYILALAVILALCVLSHLQLAGYPGMSVALYWLARRSFTQLHRLAGGLAMLGGVAVLALLLSAVQWMPTVELALASQRSNMVHDITGNWLRGTGLLRFLAPTLAKGYPRTAPGFGPPKAMLLHPYVGLLPLLLALLGAWRARTAQSTTYVVVALVTGTLMLLPPTAVSALPFLNQLPTPDRWDLSVSLALAVLTAYGLDGLLGTSAPQPMAETIDARPRPDQLHLYTVRQAVSIATVLGLLAILVLTMNPFTAASRYVEYGTALRTHMDLRSQLILSAGLVVIGFGLITQLRGLTHLLPVQLRRWLIGVGALVLIACDLGWYGPSLQSSADPRQIFQPTPKLLAAIGQNAVQNELSGDVVYPPTRTSAFLARHPGLYRVLSPDPFALLPNTLSIFGVQDVRGYASLYSQRYLRFVERWEGHRDPREMISVSLTDASHARQLLDLMGVRYIFFVPHSKQEARYTGLKLIERNDESAIYLNPTALPRAFLVHRAEIVPDDDTVLARLTAPGFPISTTALLTEASPALARVTAGGLEVCDITRYAPLSVTVAITAQAPALLLLSDTNYPGWEAFVDRQPAHVYTVDAILRGVAVPAGHHMVAFSYRPRSFMIGVTLSVSALFGLALAVAWMAIVQWRSRASPLADGTQKHEARLCSTSFAR